MAAIEIRDLTVSKELDRKAMAKISGGVGFIKMPTPVVSGWTLVSTSTQKVNAGQLWVPSKNIPGAFEPGTMFQYETTVTLKHTEYGTS